MGALLLILKLVPIVTEAVVSIESIIKGRGKGVSKKDLIMGAVAEAAKVGEQTDNKTVEMVSGLVDQVVTTLNSTGVFQK